MNRNANYIIVVAGPDRVVIRDVGPWDRYLSVTNDAENVVRELAGNALLRPGRRLFYYDSDGQLDEILFKDGQFVGFAPGPGGAA
ncbi:MAG: hypothetical protein IMZ46_02380 [Acidobacteria bacterium]|nr:hypothetical protein [Acidobacteriota bacterium]